MSIDRPVIRHLAAACLAVAALLAVAAGPAAALEPPRPLPGNRPAFVTETDQHPWRDCLWASAAMLLDKWTNGDVTRTHQQLRALSGDRKGGSTFRDLHVAFGKLGFRVPDNLAGNRLSWSALLSRLRHGAGAVVLGDYADLPRWYGRWDAAFWKARPVVKHLTLREKRHMTPEARAKAKAKARKQAKPRPDNHAIYIERYDPHRGRVWLMDPLGRGGWDGEWISVSALKRFAWSSGGHVYAVVTPTAAEAPFTGVRLSDPAIGVSDAAITATWGLQAPRRWRWPGADVHVSIAHATSPLEAAAHAALLAPRPTTDAAPRTPVAGLAGHQLRVSAALPTTPGVYTAAVSITDRRFGRRVAASVPVPVFVPGEQRAALGLTVAGDVLTAGGTVRVNLSVANGGETTWAESVGTDGEAAGPALGGGRERDTRVTAHWIRLDTPAAAAGETAGGDAGPVTLLRVPLDPGELARYHDDLLVPSGVGRWALVVDVEDSVLGSFAALGNAPAVAVFEVVPPRGIEAVE